MAATTMTDRPTAPTERSRVSGEPTERSRVSGEPTVQAIIAAGRRPQPAPARGAWLCGGASALLWYLSFFPANWGPLAFLAPIPLLLLARVEDRPRRTYLAVYATWLAATLTAMSWMAANGPMVPAWIALALYVALYAPAFLLACRTAVHRLNVPFVVAAPLTWVGLEFLRARLMTGFPWYFLGHTQWRWTTLIQICDLVGVYGLSFLVMAAAAAVAICLPARIFTKLRLLPTRDGVASPPPTATTRQKAFSVAFAVSLLAAALAYGAVRISGEEFTPGPRMALVQGNFPSRLSGGATGDRTWFMHNYLTKMGVQYQPDFVVWPESGYPWKLLDASPDLTDSHLEELARRVSGGQIAAAEWRGTEAFVKESLHDLATQSNAGLLVGLSSVTADPEDGLRRYNSAAFSRPELGLVGRYDKRHLVAFGEYVPLRDVFPFLRAFTPYTDGFSCDPGQASQIFRHANVSISPLICYEDTVPQLVRGVVAGAESGDGEGLDVLVNVTNDGWFFESAEQEQHLVTSLFRAVETRTPLVRAANTGISAVIDGGGRIVAPIAIKTTDDGLIADSVETTDGTRFVKDRHAVIVADVPLDPRRSLYVRFGDWFAGLCAAATLFGLAWSAMPRKKSA